MGALGLVRVAEAKGMTQFVQYDTQIETEVIATGRSGQLAQAHAAGLDREVVRVPLERVAPTWGACVLGPSEAENTPFVAREWRVEGHSSVETGRRVELDRDGARQNPAGPDAACRS